MEKEKRLQMIIDYATKVVQYSKGTKGYDPVDMINLEGALDKYNQEKANFTSQSKQDVIKSVCDCSGEDKATMHFIENWCNKCNAKIV